MSTIVILTFGTYGDVAPYLGLAGALRDRGHHVAIASQERYRELVAGAGFEYRHLPKDTEQETRDSTTAQDLIDGRRMKPSRHAVREMTEQMQGVGPAMADASQGADILLCSGPVGALFGYHIAEALGVPSAALYLQPLAPTGDFAPPVLTLRSFGRLGNRAMWRMGALGEKVYLPQVNQVRRDLGLPEASRQSYQARRDALWPVLFGFSEHVVPRPSDWRAGLRMTGYWWPPEPADVTPPASLAEFLADGPPPVFVGFGSTASATGDRLSRIAADAARRAGLRVVLQSGWAGLRSDEDHVLTIDAVPYSWLFPRMAAVVHHCGAGTTAAGLRAGVPAVPVPGIMDQPYWAQRLVRLGVAPDMRRRPDLDVDWLAGALRTATSDPGYRDRARELSALLAEEDGAATAARAIEELPDQPV